MWELINHLICFYLIIKFKIYNGKPYNIFVLVLYTSLLILKNIDLTNQNWIAISHIDGTNKFNKNNFPLVVFGSRNINKTFRPLVFYVTSHEEMEDYTNSYKS